MRKLAFLLCAFALALAPPLWAQSSGTITTTSTQCPSLDASRMATVSIQITGTWTGTLTPEIAIQGSNSPQTTQVTPSNSSSPQTSITANGVYYASGGGVIYVCGPTSSGTANVYLQPVPGSAAILGNSGGTSSTLAQTSNSESYLSWQPGTLYPQVLSGTCVFSASTTCSVSYPTTFSSTPTVQITPFNPGTVTFTLTSESTSGFTVTASSSNSLTVNYVANTPAGINCETNTIVLAGARQNVDFVAPLWPASLPANVAGTMRVAASDQVEVRLCNPTASTVSFASAMSFGAKMVRQ